MSHPPRPPWFTHPNNIRWSIQAVKFIIMQFSPNFFVKYNLWGNFVANNVTSLSRLRNLNFWSKVLVRCDDRVSKATLRIKKLFLIHEICEEDPRQEGNILTLHFWTRKSHIIHDGSYDGSGGWW
jgi:hypothetical protein